MRNNLAVQQMLRPYAWIKLHFPINFNKSYSLNCLPWYSRLHRLSWRG